MHTPFHDKRVLITGASRVIGKQLAQAFPKEGARCLLVARDAVALEENRKQLAYKPFAVVQPDGRGFVIAFTQDPNVRAYLDGLNVIFANAIFRGAAHARPVR